MCMSNAVNLSRITKGNNMDEHLEHELIVAEKQAVIKRLIEIADCQNSWDKSL